MFNPPIVKRIEIIFVLPSSCGVSKGFVLHVVMNGFSPLGVFFPIRCLFSMFHIYIYIFGVTWLIQGEYQSDIWNSGTVPFVGVNQAIYKDVGDKGTDQLRDMDMEKMYNDCSSTTQKGVS